MENVLNIPKKIVTCQRTVSSGVDALCILLKRIAFPCRYTDMVPTFGTNETELCLIYNSMLDYIYAQHHHRLQSWNQHFLQPAVLEEYAYIIQEKGAPLENCFIDCTVIKICRPKPIYQRIVYNVHKRIHSIKFQSLALPNGLVGNLSEPYEGRRHDSIMLDESSLLNDLRRFAWHNHQPLCIYGDPAYQLSHLQVPYRQAQNNQDMISYNKAMGDVRVTVEWLFGNIKNYFKFTDFKKEMKLCLSRTVGKVYALCALLQNAHTCVYGNQVSAFFGMEPMNLQEYLS